MNNIWDRILNNRDLTASERNLIEVLRDPKTIQTDEISDAYIFPNPDLSVAVKLSTIVLHFNKQGYAPLNNSGKIDETIESLNKKGHNIIKLVSMHPKTHSEDTYITYYENGKGLLDSKIAEFDKQLTEYEVTSKNSDKELDEIYNEVEILESERKNEINKRYDEELKKVVIEIGIPVDQRSIALKEGKNPRLSRLLKKWLHDLQRIESEKRRKERSMKNLEKKISKVEENITTLEGSIQRFDDYRDMLRETLEGKSIEILSPIIDMEPPVKEIKETIEDYINSTIEMEYSADKIQEK